MWCHQLLLIVLVASLVPGLLAKRKGANGNCGEWVKGTCVAKSGTCGDGTLTMSREGDGCKKTEKTIDCEISCTDGSIVEKAPAGGRDKVRGKGKGKIAPVTGCKYDKGEWSACGSDGLIRRTDRLRADSPSECKPTRTNSRTCAQSESIMCRYTRGRWSPCRVGDKGYEERVRIDSLRPASPSTCPQSRSISKECYDRKPLNCRYDAGEWSECVDNERMLNKTLLSGPADKCEPFIAKQRKCTDENGNELCFYGPWGDIPECDDNDERIVERPLVGGDAAKCTETTKTLNCHLKGNGKGKGKGKGKKNNKGDRKQKKNKKRKNKKNGNDEGASV